MKKCVKKSIGLMLVASMTVSSLTGCGSTAEESKDTTSKQCGKNRQFENKQCRRNFDKQDGYFKRLRKEGIRIC